VKAGEMNDSPVRHATRETFMYPSAVCMAVVFTYPVHVGQLEDTDKGNWPRFARAAEPGEAERPYERFVEIALEPGR
jgi:hypothetical protein